MTDSGPPPLPRSTSAPQIPVESGTEAGSSRSGQLRPLSSGNQPTSSTGNATPSGAPPQVLYPLLPHGLVPLSAGHTHICCVPAHNGVGMHAAHIAGTPVYVLAADGSQLYLLDPSKPPRNEEPPPYARPRETSGSVQSSLSNRCPSPSPSRVLPWASHRVQSRHRAATVGAVPVRVSPLSSPIDETTPLLGAPDTQAWRWSEIIAGWRVDGGGAKGYFAPISSRRTWRAVAHLLVMNFPFNLVIWPPLLVGTIVGTALLITLPIGAVFWWLTLMLARWAASAERKMQQKYHGAIFGPPRPLFYYPLEVRGPEGEVLVVQERRFLKCSWAMFSDHYSYAALSYFLLIKPLLVLLSTIALVALFPLVLVFFPLLPIYLRAAVAWGAFQARIATENV